MTAEGVDLRIRFPTQFHSELRAVREGSWFTRVLASARSMVWSELPKPYLHIELDRVQQANGKEITVAIVDSGFSPSQTEIDERRVLQCHQFFEDSAGEPVIGAGTDELGHGTKMAGIVAATSDQKGVATQAMILPIKVVAADGKDFSLKAVAAALEWLADPGPDGDVRRKVSVVNLSFSDDSNGTHFDAAAADAPILKVRVARAIERLLGRDVVVVAATGNDFPRHTPNEGMGFPAVLPGVISVAAVHAVGEENRVFDIDGLQSVIKIAKPDSVAPFSQRLHLKTESLPYTRLMAPGVDIPLVIVSPDPGDSEEIKEQKLAPYGSGTSAATAVVTGVVALLQQAYRDKFHKPATCRQVEGWLRSTGVPIKEDFLRLNASAAVGQARNPPSG